MFAARVRRGALQRSPDGFSRTNVVRRERDRVVELELAGGDPPSKICDDPQRRRLLADPV